MKCKSVKVNIQIFCSVYMVLENFQVMQKPKNLQISKVLYSVLSKMRCHKILCDIIEPINK